MSTKQSILNNLLHDLTICQHLYTKIDASNANWCPTPKMRTTEELMQYLSNIGKATIGHLVNPPADRASAMPAAIAASKAAAATVTFANFSEMIELEKTEISKYFADITDEDLNRKTYMYFNPSQDITLLDGLLYATRFLCAYRHQLFMYAKMCGADIATINNWAGMDAPPAAVKEAVEEEVA